MKKPSSGVQTGLYVFGAVVGLYLVGAGLVYVDYRRGYPFFKTLPRSAQNSIETIYRPFFLPLVKAFPDLFPPVAP